MTLTITTWPTQTRPAQGRITEVLGDVNAPVDTTVIIRMRHLRRAQRRGTSQKPRISGLR